MRLQWPKLHVASLSHRTCTLYSFSSFVLSLLPNDNPFKNIVYELIVSPTRKHCYNNGVAT